MSFIASQNRWVHLNVYLFFTKMLFRKFDNHLLVGLPNTFLIFLPSPDKPALTFQRRLFLNLPDQ